MLFSSLIVSVESDNDFSNKNVVGLNPWEKHNSIMRTKNKITDVITFIGGLSQEDILYLINTKEIQFNQSTLSIDEVSITREAIVPNNKSLLSSDTFSIHLSMEITNELKEERIAREIVSLIQKKRKEVGLNITDRIRISFNTDNELARVSLDKYSDYVKKETLCTELVLVNKILDTDLLNFKIYLNIKKS